MPRLTLSILVCAFLLPTPVPAQEILGIDFLIGDVYKINPKTGQTTRIGTTGLNQNLWHSMARDSQGRIFSAYGYWSVPYAIYEINPSTGQATFVSQTALKGISGLAFGPGDVLFAVNDRAAPVSYGPDDLHTIDLATGSDALIGPTNLVSMGSLVYGQGSLWGYDGDLGLVNLDSATGAATDVNPSFVGPRDFNESYCFSDDAVLYEVDAGLWVQDTLTGVPTFVGPLNYFGILGGIEYLPGPTSPFVLGTLGETGGPMGAQVWGATPNGSVVLLYALGAAGATLVPSGQPCAGTLLNLNSTVAAATILHADSQGHALVGPAFAPAAVAGSARLQALDITTCATSNLAQVIY